MLEWHEIVKCSFLSSFLFLKLSALCSELLSLDKSLSSTFIQSFSYAICNMHSRNAYRISSKKTLPRTITAFLMILCSKQYLCSVTFESKAMKKNDSRGPFQRKFSSSVCTYLHNVLPDRRAARLRQGKNYQF